MTQKTVVDNRIFPPTRPIMINIGDAEAPRIDDVKLVTETNDEPGGHPMHVPEHKDVVRPAVLP
jgi:hypothetical protein